MIFANEVTSVPSQSHGRAANLAPDRDIMTMTVGGSPIKGGPGKDPTAEGALSVLSASSAWTKEGSRSGLRWLSTPTPKDMPRLMGYTLGLRPVAVEVKVPLSRRA